MIAVGEKLRKRWRIQTLRSLPTGAGFKPPRAALAEDRCRERRGKSRVHVARQVRIEKTSTSEPS